jgi:conjugative relaxase-like TrwC/TraI family protein
LVARDRHQPLHDRQLAALQVDRPPGQAERKHAGRRVDDRDVCFDLSFSDVKSGSLFHAGADEATRREYVAARQEAIRGMLGWLEQHAVGVRRGHGGAEHRDGRGLLAIGYDHRTSREGDPQLHTHMLVQNLTEGPDGRATALDSKRLWAHLSTSLRRRRRVRPHRRSGRGLASSALLRSAPNGAGS